MVVRFDAKAGIFYAPAFGADVGGAGKLDGPVPRAGGVRGRRAVAAAVVGVAEPRSCCHCSQSIRGELDPVCQGYRSGQWMRLRILVQDDDCLAVAAERGQRGLIGVDVDPEPAAGPGGRPAVSETAGRMAPRRRVEASRERVGGGVAVSVLPMP